MSNVQLKRNYLLHRKTKASASDQQPTPSKCRRARISKSSENISSFKNHSLNHTMDIYYTSSSGYNTKLLLSRTDFKLTSLYKSLSTPMRI